MLSPRPLPPIKRPMGMPGMHTAYGHVDYPYGQHRHSEYSAFSSSAGSLCVLFVRLAFAALGNVEFWWKKRRGLEQRGEVVRLSCYLRGPLEWS